MRPYPQTIPHPLPPLPSETGEGDVAQRRGARGCISVGCSKTGVAKAKVLKVLKVLNFSGAGEAVLWRWGWECKVGGGRYPRTAHVLVVADPLSERANIYIDGFNFYHGCFDDHRNRSHWRHNRWFDSALITRNRARRRRAVPLDRASPMPRRCRLVSRVCCKTGQGSSEGSPRAEIPPARRRTGSHASASTVPVQ